MRTLWRCFAEYRRLWRLWAPLLVLSSLLPIVVLVMPLIERTLIDQIILAGRSDLLASALMLYAACWLTSSLGLVIAAPLRTALSERLTIHLRERLLHQCERLSLAFARREHSGQTVALFMSDVPSIAGVFGAAALAMLSSTIAIIAAVLVMVSMNWQLAIVAGLTPALTVTVATAVTRPLRPAARRAQEKAAELSERLQENLGGMREILAFGQGRSRAANFITVLHELYRLRMRIAILETTIGTGQSLLSLAVTLSILGFGGYLVIEGRTTLGTLVAMQSLFGYVFQPAMQIAGTIGTVQKSLGAADRVYGFLDREPEVRERPSASAPRSVNGTVRFDHVCFSYEPGRPVLDDATFTAEAGEVTAIVGPSGAGKTTLMSLIPRFYDPTDGAILLDGTDLRDLTLTGLRETIGVVFQDTYLFAATVRENIAFGRADASHQQIVAAARAASAWDFIEELPQGLDTYIGERGVRLSEGQKQRLGIARALLRDPRILLLDEPTSALDAHAELLVQSALDILMRGRTTFVIAHRLATVQRADRILVLDRGRIVEQGTHAELIRHGGPYAQLCELQFGVAADRPGKQPGPPVIAPQAGRDHQGSRGIDG
jgi:ATP-binding cassette, subfamily B, bacterial MsbA